MTTSSSTGDPFSGGAGGALDGLTSQAETSAASIDAAFSKAGDSLAKSLAKAASDGKLSLQDLAKAGVQAVEALAASVLGAGSGTSGTSSAAGGLGAALGSALGSALGFGARADGGPVAAGGAYLVGERGPEVFTPTAGGQIGGTGPSGMAVTLNVQGATSPEAFLRSEAQLSQALYRAVALGARGPQR